MEEQDMKCRKYYFKKLFCSNDANTIYQKQCEKKLNINLEDVQNMEIAEINDAIKMLKKEKYQVMTISPKKKNIGENSTTLWVNIDNKALRKSAVRQY